MSAEQVRIVPAERCLRLRSISEGDLDSLRSWKNRFRDRFFHQALIEPAGQIAWYRGFRDRPDDFMYVAEATCTPQVEPFGCLGFRILGDVVDVYNVIRGRSPAGQRCSMRDALAVLCSHAAGRGMPINLKVLKSNPAIAWYEDCGFARVEEAPEYFLMRLREDLFVPTPFRLEDARDIGFRVEGR